MGKGQLSDFFFFFFSFCAHEFKKTDAQFQVHTNSIPCTLCSLTVQTLLLQRLILHTLTKYQCSSAFLLSNYVECDSNANFAKQLRIKHQNTVYKTSVTFLFLFLHDFFLRCFTTTHSVLCLLQLELFHSLCVGEYSVSTALKSTVFSRHDVSFEYSLFCYFCGRDSVSLCSMDFWGTTLCIIACVILYCTPGV